VRRVGKRNWGKRGVWMRTKIIKVTAN